MSEVITGVVNFAFGFLAKKIRSGIAESLKDGDIVDAKLRGWIITNPGDIKSKLNDSARKDLLTSLLFLEEGVNKLFRSLRQVNSNENTAESTDQELLLEIASIRDGAVLLDSPRNETLINAMASLNINSNDQFVSAIKSFANARENATLALGNRNLLIEDLIQASQVRIMATILEQLYKTDESASDCLLYLKQLHAIPKIKKTFSVWINKGIKSTLKKKERREITRSVEVLNQMLFEFIKKFTKLKLLATMFTWPTISLGKKTYLPLSLHSDITFGDEISSEYLSVVNSKGDIVALTWDQRTFKVFKRSGETRILCEAPTEERRAAYVRIMAMDIDAKDNLYVITLVKSTPYESWNLKLFVFDENGNKKIESPLPFRAYYESVVLMAIMKDGKIAVLNCGEEVLYIFNVRAELNSVIQLVREINVEKLSIHSLRFSSNCDGTIVAASFKTVYIYTKNEQLKLQPIFEKPTEHEEIRSIAINHATKCVLVKTYQSSIGFTLLSFSATGELRDSVCLGRRHSMRYARLISHSNGPVALVHETGAILLQL